MIKGYTKKILEDHNSAEWQFEYLLPILEEVELSESDYRSIKDKCEELGLELIVTPFDIESCDFCVKIGIDAYKISSADMVNYDLIERCFSHNKPVIISTGMWTELEITNSVKKYNQIKKLGYKFENFIHEKSYIAGNVIIGDNCFILENQTIQSKVTLGNNIIIWSSNHIGHSTTIASHTYLSSHIVISGNCNIGERCFFGVNSSIK